MGRHAAASSRSSQKWQVAGNRNSEATSEVFRPAVNRGCEEKLSTSTPSPTAATTTLISKGESRERWADIDIESDGDHGDDAQDPKSEGAGSGKRSGRIRPKLRQERAAKPDPAPPVPVRSSRDTFASARQTSIKQPEVSHSSAPTPYRPPKPDSRKNASQDDHHYESSNTHHWEASSWGTSGSGWKSSSKTHGSSWDAGGWDQKQETRASDSRKHRGKEKNESFKRGPHVTTNMDASRLAW